MIPISLNHENTCVFSVNMTASPVPETGSFCFVNKYVEVHPRVVSNLDSINKTY